MGKQALQPKLQVMPLSMKEIPVVLETSQSPRSTQNRRPMELVHHLLSK